MKTLTNLCILLAMAAVAYAQTGTLGTNGTSQTTTASKYLVEYSTTEKCYECGTRFAIGCLPDSPDCGVPNKAVSHFVEFDSIRDALTFVNTGMYRDGDLMATISMAWELKAQNPRTFVRLMAIQAVALDKEVKTVEEPQPPKKVETVTYRHGSETGESPRAKSVWPSITCPDSSACSAGTSLSFGSIAVGSERIIPGVAK